MSNDTTSDDSGDAEQDEVDPSLPDGFYTKANEFSLGKSLPPEEFAELNHLAYEMASKTSRGRLVFLLGSFEDEDKERIKYLQKRINKDSSDLLAVLMDDFQDVRPIMKFRLIAYYSDYIVGVCEHDRGGFTLEQGIIVTHPELFGKTYILKREYTQNDEEKANYSWMQSLGLFHRFQHEDRLLEWTNEKELDERITVLLELLS